MNLTVIINIKKAPLLRRAALKKGSFGEDSLAPLDRYTLFASHKDDLVYVSSCTHSAQSSWEKGKREETEK